MGAKNGLSGGYTPAWGKAEAEEGEAAHAGDIKRGRGAGTHGAPGGTVNRGILWPGYAKAGVPRGLDPTGLNWLNCVDPGTAGAPGAAGEACADVDGADVGAADVA
ncbi:unnamed protein product [Closterium sp. NIES-53]